MRLLLGMRGVQSLFGMWRAIAVWAIAFMNVRMAITFGNVVGVRSLFWGCEEWAPIVFFGATS